LTLAIAGGRSRRLGDNGRKSPRRDCVEMSASGCYQRKCGPRARPSLARINPKLELSNIARTGQLSQDRRSGRWRATLSAAVREVNLKRRC
jgi:hypothetical protein